MNNKEFADKLKNIATNYKTLYVMGCFGAPLTAANKKRYINNGSAGGYNARSDRKAMINAASADTFGFDCVNLIKAVLWGWNGDKNKNYGGAGYAVNGVPDISADAMIEKCKNLSTNFTTLEIGEAVWCKGHIGVYIGNGLAVECTPSWKNKVQITSCNCTKSGYNRRNWTKHGRLPYITYVTATTGNSAAQKPSKSVDEIAREVIAGKWGNGDTRKNKLTVAGYNYAAVQKRVNELCKQPTQTKKTVDEIAREVIAGKWGNGTTRKNKLTAAGYNYTAVQKRVNELLK